MPGDFTINDMIRFWGYTDRSGGPDACWPWTGMMFETTDSYGSVVDVRGVFKLRGRQYFSSRVAYFFEYRRDPGRLLVCHECNNPPCVNPRHLFLGTNSDNQQHRGDCGRSARGSLHSQATFYEEDIARIKQRLAAGESQLSIARSLGVSQSLVSMINTGKRWAHVT